MRAPARCPMSYYRPDGEGGLELVVCQAGPEGRDVKVKISLDRAMWHNKFLTDFIYARRDVVIQEAGK